VIDRLAANGIDLTRMPVEVAPIAHYHMGGVAADVQMQTRIPGLLVAGEAVGGANGANRLSGNAITEALVFGREAGRSATARAKSMHAVPVDLGSGRGTLDLMGGDGPKDVPNSAEMLQRLQAIMADDVGPLRTGAGLSRALARIGELDTMLGDRPFGGAGAFDLQRLEWFDLRNMLLVARAVTESALLRTESRGAHQREDFPGMLPQWRVNQTVRLRDGRPDITQTQASPTEVAAQ
jgi:succinate dehydrogenase/fumarate reductase flavoprotein subunit